MQEAPRAYLDNRLFAAFDLARVFMYIIAGSQTAYLPGIFVVWTGDLQTAIQGTQICKAWKMMLQLWHCVRCGGAFLLRSPRPVGDRGSGSRLLALPSRCDGCIGMLVHAASPTPGTCRHCRRRVDDLEKHRYCCPAEVNERGHSRMFNPTDVRPRGAFDEPLSSRSGSASVGSWSVPFCRVPSSSSSS